MAVARQFWWPVYGAVRDRGESPESSSVLTSRLLVRLAKGSPFLRHEDHDGRLRRLVQAELAVVLAHAGGTESEGGVDPLVDVAWAETRDDYGPESALSDRFRQRWATVVLEIALSGLRARAVESGVQTRVEHLIPCLARRLPDWRTTDIGDAVDFSEVENLRDQFRTEVRRTVSLTVATPMSLEAELADLFG